MRPRNEATGGRRGHERGEDARDCDQQSLDALGIEAFRQLRLGVDPQRDDLVDVLGAHRLAPDRGVEAGWFVGRGHDDAAVVIDLERHPLHEQRRQHGFTTPGPGLGQEAVQQWRPVHDLFGVGFHPGLGRELAQALPDHELMLVDLHLFRLRILVGLDRRLDHAAPARQHLLNSAEHANVAADRRLLGRPHIAQRDVLRADHPEASGVVAGYRPRELIRGAVFGHQMGRSSAIGRLAQSRAAGSTADVISHLDRMPRGPSMFRTASSVRSYGP
jgi:hypothetical protein